MVGMITIGAHNKVALLQVRRAISLQQHTADQLMKSPFLEKQN